MQVNSRRTASCSRSLCLSAAMPPPNRAQQMKAGVIETYRKLVAGGMDRDAAQQFLITSVQLVAEPLAEIKADIRQSFQRFEDKLKELDTKIERNHKHLVREAT